MDTVPFDFSTIIYTLGFFHGLNCIFYYFKCILIMQKEFKIVIFIDYYNNMNSNAYLLSDQQTS